MDGGGDHYSSTTSGGHNFHSVAPIDAPFVPTRSLFRPLRFYTNKKRMWLELGCMDGVLGYSMARRTSRKCEARGAIGNENRGESPKLVFEEVLREGNRFPANFGNKRFESFKLYNPAEIQQNSRESILPTTESIL
ncbi:hypothetical protein PIB30_061197 [Stylosanthes scabra]|uniref:Uncharacterized protein n=1 Tax=Stylosanthes scabra TaxID=79078 RepID=A0ABU6VKA6_9FABA|nr:hypothetical protein [Stylosanthes scabra]